MNRKEFLILFFALLLIIVGGCSKDINKANVNAEMFNSGKEVVKQYAKAYNGDKSAEKKAIDLASAFEDTYENKHFSSKSDEIFLYAIKLLQTEYLQYALAKSVEDDGKVVEGLDSDKSKEKVKNRLLEIKNEFGISLD